VGLDFKQIEAFHWSRGNKGRMIFVRPCCREALEQAVELRQQILELAERDDPLRRPRSGDISILAAGHRQGENDCRRMRRCFLRRDEDAAGRRSGSAGLDLVRNWILLERRANDEARTRGSGKKDAGVASTARDELAALGEEARQRLTPFHWWLEFPEVFFEERPDPLQGVQSMAPR